MTFYLGFGFPGGWELWLIFAIFLLLFGHRIPGMARAMGSGIVEFKKGLKDGSDSGSGSSDGGDPGATGTEDSKGQPQDGTTNS